MSDSHAETLRSQVHATLTPEARQIQSIPGRALCCRQSSNGIGIPHASSGPKLRRNAVLYILPRLNFLDPLRAPSEIQRMNGKTHAYTPFVRRQTPSSSWYREAGTIGFASISTDSCSQTPRLAITTPYCMRFLTCAEHDAKSGPALPDPL